MDTRCSSSSGRKAMPIEAVIAELTRNSGSQFDPVVVDAFLRMLSREPDLAPPAGGDQQRNLPRL